MSRRKQANKSNWSRLNKEIEEVHNSKKEIKDKEIDEQQHNERVELLKKIGILK